VQHNDSALTHPISNSVSVNLWRGTNLDVHIQFDHLRASQNPFGNLHERDRHSPELRLHRFRLVANSLYLLQSYPKYHPNKLLNSHHEVNLCIMVCPTIILSFILNLNVQSGYFLCENKKWGLHNGMNVHATPVRKQMRKRSKAKISA
jgi:hypothetical protein